PVPAGSRESAGGAAEGDGGGATGATGTAFVAGMAFGAGGATFAIVATGFGAVALNRESRIPDPGFNVSSAGSCPSSRSGYVDVSCDAIGVLLGAAAVDAAGNGDCVTGVGSVAVSIDASNA